MGSLCSANQPWFRSVLKSVIFGSFFWVARELIPPPAGWMEVAAVACFCCEGENGAVGGSEHPSPWWFRVRGCPQGSGSTKCHLRVAVPCPHAAEGLLANSG